MVERPTLWADVLQRALDPRVAPRRILCSHPHDQRPDLEEHASPTACSNVRPRPGNQLAMPPQQRVGRRDRGDVPQGRTADSVRSCGQPTAIVVRETQPMPTKLTPQEPVFVDQARDRLPLPAVQPADQHAQHHLPHRGVDHEAQRTSQAGPKDSDESWNTTPPIPSQHGRRHVPLLGRVQDRPAIRES